MSTRNDVARLAGVSGATVTRVINNSELVSEETRQKVLEAVKALRYSPNYSGRSLRNKATRQILVYCPGLFNPFYVHVFYGMDDYAQQTGYSVVLTRHFEESTLLQGRYDGMILSVVNVFSLREHLRFIESTHIPIIGANFYAGDLTIPYIRMDIQQAGRLAVDHLCELGHRNILYLDDNSVIMESKWNHIQKRAEERGMTARRLLLNPAPELHDSMFEVGSLYAGRVQRLIDPPTAVIVANDALAFGLLSGLNSLNLRVPEDLSVISFDDTCMAQYTIPPLTTVHFPKYEMGTELMRRLLRLIDGESCENASLPNRLVVRKTTAPPAASI